MTGKGRFWDSVEGRAPVPPAAQTLGFTLREADPENGTIVVEFDGQFAFTNPFGEVLGGFLAAMLYDTLGPAVLITLGDGQFIATDNLQLDFLQPARQGPIVGRARIVSREAGRVRVEGQLTDSSGALVATGAADIRITGP